MSKIVERSLSSCRNEAPATQESFQDSNEESLQETPSSEASASCCKARLLRRIVVKEIAFVKDLQILQKFLRHPFLQQSTSSMEDFLAHVTALVSFHVNLMDHLSTSNCLIGQAFLNFTAAIGLYRKYCTSAGQVNAIIWKISWHHKNEPWKALHRHLDEPLQQFCWYEILFEKLHRLKIKDENASVLTEVYEIFKSAALEMKAVYDVQVNAYKLLQMQKALVGRQPRIFAAGRKLLKDGWLYKVKSRGCGARERLFFLFNDILMCCKLINKSAGWDTPECIICCSLISISSAFVSYVLGAPKEGRAVFQVVSGHYSYLLYSETVGVAQNWVETICNAIGSFTRTRGSLWRSPKAANLKRSNVIIRRQMPLIRRRLVTSGITSHQDP